MMEKNIVNDLLKALPLRRRVKLAFGIPFFCFFLFSSLASAQTLLETTVATVSQHAITLKDLEAIYLVQRILSRGKAPNDLRLLEKEREFIDTRDLAIQFVLIKNYLTSTGLLGSVPEKGRNTKMRQVENAFGSKAKASRYLTAQGLNMDSVQKAIEALIRKQFFEERFLAFRINIRNRDIQEYYDKNKGARFRGRKLEEVRDSIRLTLQKPRIQDEFKKWLKAEMRRTEILFLPLPRTTKEALSSTSKN